MNNIRKKRALVTGATRGIGFAITKNLMKDGIEVIATGTKERGSFLKGCTYKKVDFLKDNEVKGFLDYLRDQEIDILINNAGINKISNFVDIPEEDFDEIIKVNLKLPFLLCQVVIPYMKSRKWGRIVNISSIFGTISKEMRAPYSASKFGLDGMTVALSAELSEFGILANSVGPGFINTDMTRGILGKTGIKEVEKKIPIKRLGEVEEIAELTSWLVSESNTYLTGQHLLIDGGFSRV